MVLRKSVWINEKLINRNKTNKKKEKNFKLNKKKIINVLTETKNEANGRIPMRKKKDLEKESIYFAVKNTFDEKISKVTISYRK